MKITLTCPYKGDYIFDIQDAFAKEDGELLVVGHSSLHDRLEVRGVKIVKEDVYLYHVKYQTQKLYKAAMAINVGETCELKSLITLESIKWIPEVYKKVNVESVKALLSTYDNFHESAKSPLGIMVPSDLVEKIDINGSIVEVKKWIKVEE